MKETEKNQINSESGQETPEKKVQSDQWKEVAKALEANPPQENSQLQVEIKNEKSSEEQLQSKNELRDLLVAMGVKEDLREKQNFVKAMKKVNLEIERVKERESLTNEQLINLFIEIRKEAIDKRDKVDREAREEFEKIPEKDRKYGQPPSKERQDAGETLDRIYTAFKRFDLK